MRISATWKDGGELSLVYSQDQELVDLIRQDPSLSSGDIKHALLDASPLSSRVLIAALNRPKPMSSGDIKTVLVYNCPLTSTVLDTLVTTDRLLSTGDLKKILIASSPLPDRIVDLVRSGALSLSSGDRKAVLEAQTSPYEERPDHEGVNLKITLTVLPETISEDADLTLSVDDQQLVGNVDVVFTPHGITFSQPALLNIEARGLDLSGVDPSKIDIYCDDTDAGVWEKMERNQVLVDPAAGHIQVIDARIPHFSRYALARSR